LHNDVAQCPVTLDFRSEFPFVGCLLASLVVLSSRGVGIREADLTGAVGVVPTFVIICTRALTIDTAPIDTDSGTFTGLRFAAGARRVTDELGSD
jgi:hypothetical protein